MAGMVSMKKVLTCTAMAQLYGAFAHEATEGLGCAAATGADAEEDSTGLLQLAGNTRNSATKGGDKPYTCPQGYQVCPTPSWTNRVSQESHCTFLEAFANQSTAVQSAFENLGACTLNWAEPLNESCYTDPPSGAIEADFAKYASFYSKNGKHTAWGWNMGQEPYSFADHNTHELVTEFYWQYIGRQAKGWTLVLPFEFANLPTANSADVVKMGNCIRDPTDEMPGYGFFGDGTSSIRYAVAINIFDKAGYVMRQYPVSDVNTKSAIMDASTPGYVKDYPHQVTGSTPAALALQKYLAGVKAGCVACLMDLYDSQAQLSIYNAAYPDTVPYSERFATFVSPCHIEEFWKQIFEHWGDDLAKMKTYLMFAEETTEDLTGNAHFTYTVGSGKAGTTLVFTKEGKIYGEGAVVDMPGLQF